MVVDKKTKAFAKQLFKLSLVDCNISIEHVSQALSWIEKYQPRQSLALLKLYRYYVAAELVKSCVVVEQAGRVSDSVLNQIATVMGKRYGRKLTVVTQPNPALLAGFRVRVGFDVYELSVASQIASLSV